LQVNGQVLLDDQYPKLANIYFKWDITDDKAKELAKWDILLVDMEVQIYSPNALKKIKQFNPDIKILAYIASQEVRGDSDSLSGTLRQKLYQQIPSSWWLKNTTGDQVNWWPGNPIFNVTSQCPSVAGQKYYDFLPWFVKNEILSTGLWDGVFYDNVWEGIDFMSNFDIDLDQNGQPEDKTVLSASWKDGMTALLNNSRIIFGDDVLVVGNGGEGYYKYVNGTLYEHFPYKGWSSTMNKYRFITENGMLPAVGILNTNVNNLGTQDDYKKMRYGLASALMGDGFYSFDNGDLSHQETWWYDEYDQYLGRPLGQAYNLRTGQTARNNFTDNVWRRDFENGTAIVNATSVDFHVDLRVEYEKIHGSQDLFVNDGSFVSEVNLPAYDGIILLKSAEEILSQSFVNGSFARIFDSWGNVKRTGFFSYLPDFTGGAQVIKSDINNDGRLEVLTSDESTVSIYTSSGQLIKEFYPYSETFNRGINIAVADLEGDGTLEIITGTENGGGPHIRIFNSRGVLINPGFFAYARNYRGGVNIAVGDLDGNGTMEIIAGAGVGGGPHVRVFNKDGKLINPGFFAYDESFRGGVNVAVGDLDGDGKDEIITGPGNGGGPHIKIFDKDGHLKYSQFFAFNKNSRFGVEVGVQDFDHDGKDEIIATSNDLFSY